MLDQPKGSIRLIAFRSVKSLQAKENSFIIFKGVEKGLHSIRLVKGQYHMSQAQGFSRIVDQGAAL